MLIKPSIRRGQLVVASSLVLLVVLACVTKADDETLKSALKSVKSAPKGLDKLDKLLQLDNNNNNPHSPFVAENVDDNHDLLQRKAQANPDAQYHHSTSTHVDPITGTRRTSRTSSFSSSSSSSSRSSSSTTTTQRPQVLTSTMQELEAPVYSSTSSSKSFLSHQKSSYTSHNGVVKQAEVSHSAEATHHHATSGPDFHDESTQQHQAYQQDEHHETPELMDENELFDSGDDDDDQDELSTDYSSTTLPSSSSSSSEEPLEHTVEHSYIDTSDPLHPAQVHVRKEVKSVVGPNGASHSEHESKVSHSLDGTGSKSFKRKSTSSSSSYSSSTSSNSRGNGVINVDDHDRYPFDPLELDYQHKKRPAYQRSSSFSKQPTPQAFGASPLAHSGVWSHTTEPAHAFSYTTGSGATARSFASASSSSNFNHYRYNNNPNKQRTNKNHKKRNNSAKKRAKKLRKAMLEAYDGMPFDRYH